MRLEEHIQYLRIEGQATNELLRKLSRPLEQLTRENTDERRAALQELRRLDHGLMGVLDHCHSSDRVIESMPASGLTAEELQRSAAEHQRLARAITDFRSDLRFSNVDHVAELISRGRTLLKQLAAHFNEEGAILDRIARERQVTPAY